MRWIALLRVLLDGGHCLHYVVVGGYAGALVCGCDGARRHLRRAVGVVGFTVGDGGFPPARAPRGWLPASSYISRFINQGEFMLDVIDFLERMGGDAQLSQASPAELTTALADSEVTPEQRAALLARDAERLGLLLGTTPVCVLVAPPGPPGPGPIPMRPSVPPPPPPDEAGEQDLTDCSEHDGAAESPAHRRVPQA